MFMCLIKGERAVNISDEKFVEVLKSLTKEDFISAHKVVSEIGDKFENVGLRACFTEDEIKNLSGLLEDYDDEIRVAVLVTKFQEVLCLQ